MTYWALKPYSTITDLSGTFNISSATNFLNLISVFYFLILSFFRKSLPEGKQGLFFAYSLVFFIILAFFLDENIIPASKPTTGKKQGGKVFDFSDTKKDSEILSLG